MKKISVLSACLITLMLSTACDEFDYEMPSGEARSYTAAEMDPANISIADLKDKYASVISNSSFELVKDDQIFEGVVVANDISGNLYQTLVVRDGDAGIIVAVNDYSLWQRFPIGTRIRVNMNGLYIGGYGKMAKVGTPYYTSSGNLRMGAMLKTMPATNIYIVNHKDSVPETEPVNIDAAWLRNADKDDWAPMLVRLSDVEIHGIVNAETRERSLIYADAENEDAGYGVNDTILIGSTSLIFRTSSSCAFAFDTIPSGKVDVVGILTRYSSTWQMQARDINDIIIK